MSTPWQTVLDFWFGASTDPDYGKPRKAWFIKDSDFDDQVQSHLGNLYEKAKMGTLDHWQNQPESCLALVILLDQVPRNIHRNTPAAFATDEKALETAKGVIAAQFDQQLLPVQRWFLYLPFEHSENMDDQKQSLALFKSLADDPDSVSTIDYAYRHLAVIKEFGRFPHRNEILGRDSTPEEIEFLAKPGSSF